MVTKTCFKNEEVMETLEEHQLIVQKKLTPDWPHLSEDLLSHCEDELKMEDEEYILFKHYDIYCIFSPWF